MLLSHSLIGHGDITNVFSSRDFIDLLNMLDGFSLYLGYMVAQFLHHQIYPMIGVIFVGPYITQLV